MLIVSVNETINSMTNSAIVLVGNLNPKEKRRQNFIVIVIAL
jgi:hypothetical protein